MPKLKVYAFSQHIGNLCVTHGTKVHKLGAKLGSFLGLLATHAAFDHLLAVKRSTIAWSGAEANTARSNCTPPAL